MSAPVMNRVVVIHLTYCQLGTELRPSTSRSSGCYLHRTTSTTRLPNSTVQNSIVPAFPLSDDHQPEWGSVMLVAVHVLINALLYLTLSSNVALLSSTPSFLSCLVCRQPYVQNWYAKYNDRLIRVVFGTSTYPSCLTRCKKKTTPNHPREIPN